MAHAKEKDLEDLGPLFQKIRALEGLKEKSFGCFYKKGKGVLHFHIQYERRFAHVSDGRQWHEVDLPEKCPAKAQNNIFAAIKGFLPLDSFRVGSKKART